MKLCKAAGKIPLLKGANGSFAEIETDLTDPKFDGSEAVNFIIEEAQKHTIEKLEASNQMKGMAIKRY